MSRERVKRRQRSRLEAKEVAQFHRALADRGIMDRIAKVRAAVAPASAMFWHILKGRIAAREMFRAIPSLEVVRELAMAVLREEGYDLTGIILKVAWRPPVLAFDPVPSHENALEVVDEVRGSEHGRELLRKIAAIG